MPVYSVLLGSLYTCFLISAKMGDFRKSSARDVTKATDRSLGLLQETQLPVDLAK